jgi:hypothetical protein
LFRKSVLQKVETLQEGDAVIGGCEPVDPVEVESIDVEIVFEKTERRKGEAEDFRVVDGELMLIFVDLAGVGLFDWVLVVVVFGCLEVPLQGDFTAKVNVDKLDGFFEYVLVFLLDRVSVEEAIGSKDVVQDDGSEPFQNILPFLEIVQKIFPLNFRYID